MNTPTGYTALGLVGFTDKGAYSASAVYVANDLVDYQNNKWRCLIDDTTGIAPLEGANWTVFIRHSTALGGINATDTEGVVGTAGAVVTAQDLVDALAGKVVDGDIINQWRKTLTISSPASDSTYSGYGYRQAFTWAGVAADYSGDVAVSSGSYDGDIALETGSGSVTLYFSADPTGIVVTVYIYPSRAVS